MIVVYGSSPTLQDQREIASFREARIVVELRDLGRAERQDAVFDFVVRRLEQSLQFCYPYAFDAGHSLSHGDQLAQVDAFAESQDVGMEEPAPPVGQQTIAEQVRD